MATENVPENSDKQERSPVRKAVQVGIDFINPFSDLRVIWQHGARPTVDRVQLAWATLKELFRAREAKPELTWLQAVECSGKPVEVIRRHFKLNQVLWWWLMALTGAVAFALLTVMILAISDLPGETLLRASIALVILVGLSCVGFVKSLVATYRLWQLDTQRVNLEERGTFHDFLAENQWFRQVVFLNRK